MPALSYAGACLLILVNLCPTAAYFIISVFLLIPIHCLFALLGY